MAFMHQAQLEVSKLKNLPPLPEVSGQILACLNDPDISMDQLVEVLSASPILMGRLLGLANSAYFAYTQPVTSLKVAIINVLGLKLVKSLSLSVLLSLSFDSRRCVNFDSNRFWRDTLLTAICAQKITSFLKQSPVDASLAYTSGILLNIGLLVMVHVYPEQMDALFQQEKSESLNVLMMQQYNTDQFLIGGFLLNRWDLPEIYKSTLNNYTNTNYQGEAAQLISILKLTRVLAKMVLENNDDFTPEVQALIDSLSIKKTDLLSIKSKMTSNIEDLSMLAKTMSGE